ncbi:MAG: restriction endonuclease subunit S [Leptospiraceae bacterium]|nr:restriction endonuclease subunit S [Leptospiraceae bacterium]MCP5496033.1 restriction endonuclease subunit S [Leptospiraceae bacterium]
MSEMERIYLSKIVTFEKGKPPSQIPINESELEPYLTPDYLRGKNNPDYTKPGLNAVRVEDGEIIVLWDGSNAGEILKAKKGILASTMMKLNHSYEFEKEYFYYALKGWEHFLKSQTSGSGIPHVDKEILENILLQKFSKPEQTKIAEVLSTVDKAIEQTEVLIAKQQRIKTGLMQDLLTKGIDKYGNLRNEKTHKFKDSPLGRIPVEWEVVTIGKVAESIVPGRDKPILDGGSIPWITLPDIDAIYLRNNKSNLSLSKTAIKAANARLMPKNTVLMSCIGEFGIATILDIDVVANQQLHGFVCNDVILPEWL